MSTWRKIIGSNKTNLPSDVTLPEDLFPSSGDPSKVELNSWHNSNSLSKSDRDKEHNLRGSSRVIDPKYKRESVASSWRKVLADVQFEQKPDGTVKINVEYPSENPEGVTPSLDSGMALPDDLAGASLESLPNLEEKKKTSSWGNLFLKGPSFRNTESNWIIKSSSTRNLIGNESDTDCGIGIVEGDKVLETYAVKKTSRASKWRELINEAVWIEKFNSLT